MIRVARATAGAARCRVRFSVGDACALDEPDGGFHVVRSERTLQWLADPAAAVAEMARVVRPSGRISLIELTGRSLRSASATTISRRVSEAMRTERGRPSNIGRRLHDVVHDAGFVPYAESEATHTWNSWNPDESPHRMAASPWRPR